MLAWAHDHLANARALADLDAQRQNAASLRRAVSTSYYALFQALCDVCARRFVGDEAPFEIFTPVFRTFKHRAAAAALHPSQYTEGSDLKFLATAFVELQKLREWADYNPEPRPDFKPTTNNTPFTRAEALRSIELAESAVQRLGSLDGEARLRLAANILYKSR